MWSDSLSESRRRELVAALHRVLPEASGSASAILVPLEETAGAPEVASALQQEPGFVWLDNAGSQKVFPRPLLRMAVFGERAEIDGPEGSVSLTARGFEILEAALDAWGPLPGAMLCGYLGYELGAELEDVAVPPHAPSDAPDLFLALYDRWFVRDAAGWMMAGTDAWRDVVTEAQLPGSPLPDTLAPQNTETASRPDESGFCAAVDRLVSRIYDGEVFQVNLCRRVEAALAPGEAFPLFLRMREVNPADYGAFLRIGPDFAVASMSPELLLRVDDGEVRSYPIKGTRRRGATPAEDEDLKNELLASEKDLAELSMIVDVTRNDLGRVCRPGSVRVGSHAELMTLPTVHHTVSKVIGQLRDDATIPDVLRACLPAASISGAPKIRAMELVAAEEGFRRGPCMGAIGWISLDGRLELSVGIRTAVASAGRVWYLAGCGITADSVAAEEWAESEAKAAAFRQALGAGG